MRVSAVENVPSRSFKDHSMIQGGTCSRVWTEAHGTCVNASRHNQKQVPQSAIRQVSQESSGRQSGQVAIMQVSHTYGAWGSGLYHCP